ncbi:hypothetical protein ACU8KH_00990 [Lachancea thermotolerans]
MESFTEKTVANNKFEVPDFTEVGVTGDSLDAPVINKGSTLTDTFTNTTEEVSDTRYALTLTSALKALFFTSYIKKNTFSGSGDIPTTGFLFYDEISTGLLKSSIQTLWSGSKAVDIVNKLPSPTLRVSKFPSSP